VRETTVARNYAEVLFEIGEKHDLHDNFVASFNALEAAAGADRRIRQFLDSPKIDTDAKKQALRKALGKTANPLFINFLLVVLQKRRQRLLFDIAAEYRALVDEKLGRAHVQVTLAHEPDAKAQADITRQLSRVLGRDVIPHVTINREILGGIIVRYGDRVLDGSLRRRLVSLRHRLLEAELPATK